MSDLDAEKIVEKAVSYALPSVTKMPPQNWRKARLMSFVQ